MRKARICIIVAFGVCTAGCVLSGKDKKPVASTPAIVRPAPAPTPPPAPASPLSIPQTQVDLPRQQPPVDANAYSLETTPPQVEVEAPTPSRPTTSRRPTTSNPPAPRPEAAQPPATPQTAPPENPAPIQEIVPPSEAKRLQDQAQARRRDVQQMVDQLSRRNLNSTQRNSITLINSLMASSTDAEKRADMKLADALAERAQILARDLLNGK